MDFSRALFPILVFLGGCAFGPSSSVIKFAYGAGFSSGDVVCAQYFFGWIFLFVLLSGYTVFVLRRKGAGLKKPAKKTIAGLALAGVLTALVSATYIIALQTIPAYVAVLLLFQFTWIGVIIQSIAERRLPDRRTVASVAVLLAGTVIASGVIGKSPDLDLFGCLIGFSTAIFYALYMFLLGRVGTAMHPLNRSFLVMTFALVLLIVLFGPSLFTSGVLGEGLWQYGLILGSLGCAVPMFLFAIGTPHISAGAATILSSSELPASIICAVLMLGEGVSWTQWIGVVLIFAGIALANVRGKSKKSLQ
ncbi:MAG TPA: DMT family transporter [Methanocorpusculum sp.]|nr:DMT family transporter [Methanocorpusculum sp.]